MILQCVITDLNIDFSFYLLSVEFQPVLRKITWELLLTWLKFPPFSSFPTLKSCHEVTYQAFVAEFFLCGFLILVQVQLCFHSPVNFTFPPWEPSVLIKPSLMTNFSAMLW